MIDEFPGATVVREEIFSSGAADGMAARLNEPLVVESPVTVVYVPECGPVKIRFVVVAADVAVAGEEMVAVFGPVTT